MKKIYLLLIFTLTFSLSSLFAQSFKVIVNKNVSITTISKEDLSKIFLKKTKKWEDGTSILPVDLSSSSSIREEFSMNIHGKKVSAIRSYWQQAAFSGKGTAPIEMVSDEAAIEYVKTHTGAIAYISSTTNTTEVKIIKIE